MMLRLPVRFVAFVLSRLWPEREPDFVIGDAERPYMLRWWLTPWSGLNRDVPDEQKTTWQYLLSRLPGVYLHCILRSDDDRALHDHPWRNVSVLLAGSYIEHTIAAGGIHHEHEVKAGTVVLRGARAAHRLVISGGPCWSLFLTGWRTRHWGFHCPNGWVHWRTFTNPADGGKTIGKGCTP